MSNELNVVDLQCVLFTGAIKGTTISVEANSGGDGVTETWLGIGQTIGLSSTWEISVFIGGG